MPIVMSSSVLEGSHETMIVNDSQEVRLMAIKILYFLRLDLLSNLSDISIVEELVTRDRHSSKGLLLQGRGIV